MVFKSIYRRGVGNVGFDGGALIERREMLYGIIYLCVATDWRGSQQVVLQTHALHNVRSDGGARYQVERCCTEPFRCVRYLTRAVVSKSVL